MWPGSRAPVSFLKRTCWKSRRPDSREAGPPPRMYVYSAISVFWDITITTVLY